jgi:hypothetical protein
MRIGIRWVRKGTACVSLSALFLVPASISIAQTNTHSQVVYLPDPTPRPKDPDLVYGNNQDNQPRVDGKAMQSMNAKRRELVVWAANEMVALSARMEADVRQPPTADSIAAAKANAEKIEKLAKNLGDALKAQ